MFSYMLTQRIVLCVNNIVQSPENSRSIDRQGRVVLIKLISLINFYIVLCLLKSREKS